MMMEQGCLFAAVVVELAQRLGRDSDGGKPIDSVIHRFSPQGKRLETQMLTLASETLWPTYSATLIH